MVRWQKNVNLRYTATRRSGYCCGIAAFPNIGSNTDGTFQRFIMIEPFTSRDTLAPCSIAIPTDSIEEVIELLREKKAEAERFAERI